MENVVEVEKDLKVQERVSRWNCDSQTTPGHQCELESDKIEVEQNFSWILMCLQVRAQIHPMIPTRSRRWCSLQVI